MFFLMEKLCKTEKIKEIIVETKFSLFGLENPLKYT